MASPAQNATTESAPAVVRTVALEPHAISRQTSAGLTMLFDRAKGVMYELNESASAVVSQLTTEPQALEEIVDKLAIEFDAPRDEIEEDVQTFVADFTEAGLLRTSS
jgi:Coenzyme PQQ synthesis protein D (PqqD)